MHYKEETYIMQPFGTVRAVLPGETTVLPAVTILRDEEVCGQAGTGGMQDINGRIPVGYFHYRCQLVSARRFAQRCGWQMLEGESTQDILQDTLREALKAAFAEALCAYPSESGAALHGAAWQAGKKYAECALLDCGWKLTQFRPGYFEVRQEAM